jgi:ribosome-binding protein aMBF1 (putative translation factor)
VSEKLAEALRAAIQASEHSQASIAKETGIDSGIISRFVRGERTLTLSTASRIADMLGLELTTATKKPAAKGKNEGKRK